jgi:uncharacterized Zn finger protein (UPF0148 family)
MSDDQADCCGSCGYPIHQTKDTACAWCQKTADRIEELEAKLAENEVRLGKAVWRLEQMRDDAVGYRHVSYFRRGAAVTLEEFKMLESSHE